MTRSTEYSAPTFEPDAAPVTAVAEQPDPVKLDRTMPVIVTGASGLVGTRVCELLAQEGWKVRAIVRDTTKAAQRLGHLPIEIWTGDIRDSDEMGSALRGAGAVVHLAAVAIETRGNDYASINTDATRVLVETAIAERAGRFVYMSQNGADSHSPHAFLRSKGIAQDLVMSSSLRWSVVRPSVIFGMHDEFVNVLARLVRLSPVVFPLPGGGVARFQPISVRDVAHAVVTVLSDNDAVGRTYAIGGAAPLSLRQMCERILVAMRVSRALVGVPVALLRPVVAVAQRLLPNPPVTISLLDLLDVDNVIAENDLTVALGIDPVPFAPEELLYLRQITVSSAISSLFRR